MHAEAFKAVMLAWSCGVVLTNQKGKVYLHYSKHYTPDHKLIRELKYHKEAIVKALPEEIIS